MTQTVDIGLDRETKLAAMRAPIPASQILTVNKGNRGKFQYANMKYLTQRAREADPAAEIHFTSTMAPTGAGAAGVMHCEVIIFGVAEEATAGFYIPAQTKHWDNDKREYVTRDMTDDEAHTLVTAAEASAARRAFAKHGIGDELWPDKSQQQQQSTTGAQQQQYESASSSNGHQPQQTEETPKKAASEAQASWLREYGIDSETIGKLNAYRIKGPDGTFQSQIGQILDYFKNATKGMRKEDVTPQKKNDLAREALIKFAPELVPTQYRQSSRTTTVFAEDVDLD